MEPNQSMNESTIETAKTIGRKAMKMRRYRANIKKDTERYERAKEKDRKRKRKERRWQKKIMKLDKALKDENKRKRRAEQRKHRAAKKAKMQKEKAKQDMAAEKNDGTSNTVDHTAKAKRKAAIMRTLTWRMKKKLENRENADVQQSNSPFSSKSTEYRATKKVRKSLPETPEKRAHLVQKMANSPRVKQILIATKETESSTAKNRLIWIKQWLKV